MLEAINLGEEFMCGHKSCRHNSCVGAGITPDQFIQSLPQDQAGKGLSKNFHKSKSFQLQNTTYKLETNNGVLIDE